MTNFDQLRFFSTISIVAFIWSWLAMRPEPPLAAPPVESTTVMQITLLADPSPKLRNNLIEIQAKNTEGKISWWYFINEDTLRPALKKDSKLSVWASASTDEKYGGEGYIWQIKDISSDSILLTPDQVIIHRNAKNNYAKFIRFILLSISTTTAAMAFLAFKKHKAITM